MPFFFILPVWFIAAIVGIVLLFVKQLRWLATYVLCCSTAGLLLSFLLSLGLLLATARLLGGTNLAWLALLAYVAGIGLGGAIGIVIGLFISSRINRALRIRQFTLT